MSRGKELTRNTIIITIGRLSTQFISFLLLPLYTTLLSTEEFGTVDLIATLVQLIVPVISLMIDQGAFRGLLNCANEEETKKTISSAFFLLLATSIVAIIPYIVISSFFSNKYKLWLLLIMIATAFSNLFLQISRGLKHTSDYAFGSFVCSSCTIVLNVLCIAFLEMGAVGMLVATFIGNIICSLFLLFRLKILQYLSLSFVDKHIIQEELRYSVPLVPNQLSIWVMNSSDRLIVTLFLGTAANGILAVSHKFVAIYLTFFNIFLLAWHETGAIHYYDKDRDEFFTDMIKTVLSIFSTLCMAIIVVLPIVFNCFINRAYNESYYNIPIYLVASLLNVFIGLLGVVYVAIRKTTEIAKTTFVAAIINIAVHIVLIRQMGLYAASISTLIGYLLTLVYRLIDTRKYLKVKYDIKHILGICTSISVCCFVYYLNNKVVSIIIIPIFIVVAYIYNRNIIDVILVMISERTHLSRKKIEAIAITVFAMIFVVGGGAVYKKYIEKPQDIKNAYMKGIQVLEPKDIIYFSDFGADDFTCTGLTFDLTDNAFWICDYGALSANEKPFPRIVEVDREFKNILCEIELDAILDETVNLQGVAYDNKNNSLWLAIGKAIVQIDKKGIVLSTIELRKYEGYKANGICYNKEDDTIWVLCETGYLVHYEKNGTVIEELPFNYTYQDHIFIEGDYIYITVGADYNGEDNYICKTSIVDGNIASLYRTDGSNALEGVCFVDGTILIANDGLFHNDIVGKSYITIYDVVE